MLWKGRDDNHPWSQPADCEVFDALEHQSRLSSHTQALWESGSRAEDTDSPEPDEISRIRRHVSGGADRSMARPTRPTTSGRRRERRKRTIGKEREQSDPNLPPGPRRPAARFNERRSIAGCTPTYQRRGDHPGGGLAWGSSTEQHSAPLHGKSPAPPRLARDPTTGRLPRRTTLALALSIYLALALPTLSPLYGRSSPRTATGKRPRPGPPRPRARAPGC